MSAAAQPFSLRLGVWEVSTSLAGSRAPTVVRACITKPDLTPFVHGPDTIEDDPCRPKDGGRSSEKRWSMDLTCQDGSLMHAAFTLERPDRIKGSIVRIGGRKTLTHRAEVTGRWLGADCSGVR
ncbi:DUF3617 family protein [Ideonella sp. A 288]|uniref:DUF3617 domain-containing protein n=1 Tax=Ideonella sp. A 288 TaxID=1962181 RepID=UPI0013035A59|nr:DUF3617 family protein [Ideonella sp. A 288]